MDNNFTVIKASEANRNDAERKRLQRVITLCQAWQRQYNNFIKDTFKNVEKIEDISQSDLMKIAFSGIKLVCCINDANRENKILGTGNDYVETLQHSKNLYQVIDAIFTVLGCLTVRNFIITFPITKEYDGEKWGCKDYFYTMDVLAKMEWDKPIGRDKVYDLLWDYQNDDLRHAYVEFTCAMSAIYRSQTGKGIAEQWCDDVGIPTYTINNESGFVRDNQTGEIMKIKKRNNLQIVK